MIGMKTKIYILSALLGLTGATAVRASECDGTDCNIGQIEYTEIEENHFLQPATQEPVQNLQLVTVKSVEYDNRAPLWDGSNEKKPVHNADKTVDWRDGVPIWDDSISSYRYKDFSNWLSDAVPVFPTQEIIVEETVSQQKSVVDAVEELLQPKKPSENLWFASAPRAEFIAQDMTVIINNTFGDNEDGCPFETEKECEIWRKKPIVRETVVPRSKKLRDINMAEFVGAAACNTEIDASHPAAAPLLDRYKLLMRSAQACCTDGMMYSLRQAGASDGLIYKFLSDDANFYGLGSRCLMMTDHDLDTQYPNTATAVVAADVRNGCLCRGRQWFSAMLAPFEQAYAAVPEFKDARFYYTYTDGLKREVTVSINNDVQNVLKQLEQCP